MDSIEKHILTLPLEIRQMIYTYYIAKKVQELKQRKITTKRIEKAWIEKMCRRNLNTYMFQNIRKGRVAFEALLDQIVAGDFKTERKMINYMNRIINHCNHFTSRIWTISLNEFTPSSLDIIRYEIEQAGCYLFFMEGMKVTVNHIEVQDVTERQFDFRKLCLDAVVFCPQDMTIATVTDMFPDPIQIVSPLRENRHVLNYISGMSVTFDHQSRCAWGHFGDFHALMN